MASRVPEHSIERGVSGLAAFLAVLVVLSTLASFAWIINLTINEYLNVDEVLVPDVLGMDVNQAYRVLQELDFDVVSHPENDMQAAINSVTSQSLRAGSTIRRGRSVRIGIHMPPEGTQMPNLVQRSKEEAEALLEGINLNLNEVIFEHSDEPEGIIIEQYPLSGVVIGQNVSAIRVIVSRGPDIPSVALPNLQNLSISEARNRLSALGFRRVEEVVDSINVSRAGIVNTQEPEAGQTVPLTAQITLFYASDNRDVITAPNVVGQTLDEARNRLRSAGLELGWIDYVNDPERPAGVIAMEPRPNGFTLRQTPVVLRVNNPPATPNTIDTSRPEAAQEAWSRRGQPEQAAETPPPTNNTASELIPQPSNNVPGRLFEQSTTLPGSDSNAATSTPSTTSPNNTASNDLSSRDIMIRFNPADYGFLQGQENDFRLVVNDNRGERVALDRRLAPGEAVNTSVRIYGQATVQTFINGNFFQAWSP